MGKKFIIVHSKYNGKWYLISPEMKVFPENSFRDAVFRFNICLIGYEAV